MSIQAIPETLRRKLPPSTACHETSSSCRKPQKALCGGPSAGWWSAPAVGLPRFRRLGRDYKRLPTTVVGLHFLAFACLFLQRFVAQLTPS